MKRQFTKIELPEIALSILERAISASDINIIALSGDLGAGKTTITQNIARELGIKENIISPTFVIMKRYELENSKFKNLIHIDAYRLHSSEELFKLGWKEIIENKENLILIEWPEQVSGAIPEKGVLSVKISHLNEETRGLEIML